MSEITVRALGVEEWEQYKTVRLDALQDSPDAFVATLDEEKGYDEEFWRLRLQRSERLLAEVDGRTVGVASVGHSQAEGEEENPRVAELFGLWVAPEARGTGVATRLVQAGADTARRQGRSHLAYWVGSDNGRAVELYERMGFVATGRTGAMPHDPSITEFEMELVLG